MKRILFFLGLISTIFVYSQPVTATFEVDLSLYQGTYSTVEFYRAGSSYSMTSSGGNIYTYTAIVPPGPAQSMYTYKFKVDGVTETFNGTESCVGIISSDTLRIINLNTTTPSIVCWESCSPCITAIPGCTDSTAINYDLTANVDDGSCEYNITFIVDMSEVTVPFTIPEVNGTFNAWCGNCASMTDINNDSIWEIIIPLPIGNYEYKFSADNWSIQESLLSGLPCTVTAGPYTNRTLNVSGDTTLGVVCWESCGPCGGGPPAYNVTFQVDMTGVTGFTTPEVNGTFNGWCGNCWAMSDANGDSIWDFTTILAPGFYEYKFSADNWNIQEVLDSNLSCVLTTIDSLGNVFVNRLVDVISDTALDVVQWNGCASATVLGCTDSLACNYYSLATLDDGSCLTIYGCTNPFACNYDSLATCDDGSCLTIYGCMNPAAINYDSLANCPDSCIFPQAPYGCTDSTALNYNPLAIIDDSSCIYCIYGCTDILACNYDSTAQCDDGSCLTVYGCTDSLAYNFDSLATCDDNSCLYEYNVTFQLDLRGLTSILYTTPEINGIFNGWCGNCAQMTDVNNDSIWELTIPILEGSGSSGAPGWQYKFSADDWNIEENLFSGDPCTFTSSGYTNRYINVTQDTILDPVCWESCVDCFGPQSSYSVTFQVDMTNVFGFSVPEVNGEFNGWCGNCWPMTDVNGDDIWEFTATIDTSLQEYKFSADNWSIQEQLDSSMSCVFSTIDSSGNVYVNRYLSINSDTILDVICWEECTDCFIMQPSWDCNGQGDCINPGTGLGLYLDSLACTLNCQTTQLIEMKNNYIIYPNPTSEFIYINSKENIDNIIIYNKIGEIIFQIDNPLNMAEINFSGKSSDIYFMEIYNGTNVYREKVIYTQ